MTRFIAGRYQINRSVGRGGSAVVFAARDTWLDLPVAVKVLVTSDPPHAQLLAREFALLFPIHHPHLPVVHDLGRLPQTPAFDEAPPAAPYLVEELCAGSPAPGWARDRSPEQVAAVGAQVAAALAALHARDIQHGDIKPDNILVAGQERPHAKLIDFNLATKGTSTAVSGTLRYMAPEALGGARCAASDIYSLGATLTELVTGNPPDQHHGAQLEAPHLGDAVAAMTHPDSGRRADAVTAFDLLAAAAGDLAADTRALRDVAQASTGFCG
jgi:serine/threonine protein kinase